MHNSLFVEDIEEDQQLDKETSEEAEQTAPISQWCFQTSINFIVTNLFLFGFTCSLKAIVSVDVIYICIIMLLETLFILNPNS